MTWTTSSDSAPRILLVDSGRLVYDGDQTGLGAQVGARRVLMVDLAEPRSDVAALPAGLPVDVLGTEGGGLRTFIAFGPQEISAATVLGRITARVQVRDLAITEPDIEDVVRRLYQYGVRPPPGRGDPASS